MAGSGLIPVEIHKRRLLWQVAGGLWVALAVIMATRTLLSPRSHTVFPIFAASSQHWWTDQPLYAYYPSLDLFRYSPTFAVIMTPFAALGLRAGGIVWSWLSLAIFATGLWRFARDVLPERWTGSRLASFFAVAVFIAMPGIWNSQSNTLVVGLLLLAASSLTRECWWTTAILLAAAVWTKLTPLAPALLLCALRPTRLAPRFVAALALGSLIPFLTRPPDIVLGYYAEWFTQLANSSGTRWPGFRDGWTLWMAVTQRFQDHPRPFWLTMPVDSVWYRALQGVSALGTLAWCLWQRVQGASARRLICTALGMGMAWMLLFGPAVEHTTYALLAPFLAWAMLQKETWPSGRWLVYLAFLLIAVLGWDPLMGRLLKEEPLVAACLPLGSVLFGVWLIGYVHFCWISEQRAAAVYLPLAKKKSARKTDMMEPWRAYPVLTS